MNQTFIKSIEDKIEYLRSEVDRINSIVPQEGYEIITESTKRMYSYRLEQLINNNQLRLSNVKKNDDDSFVMVMMDQIFDGGFRTADREGTEFIINLPTEQLITFDNLLEVSISIVKKFNLVQCDVPRDSEKGVFLQNNLVCGTSEYSFDLYEHINIFDSQFESVMKNMKYIFNVEPFKETTWDDKYRLGFKVCCC
jgi:hypothetical protein